MRHCTALVIGGSAGSLDVLLRVLPDVKPGFDFPIIIILHRKPGFDTILTDLLSSKTKLVVKEIEEKEKIVGGVVYLAPSDYHLLIEKSKTYSLDYSEKINYARPSIDVGFQSAAEVYKDGLVCFLLSGSNADGVEGLNMVKKFGGRAIIQDPNSAAFSFMPARAELNVKVDEIFQVEEMADYINSL